ncbi:MAG: PRC and DUF2382 domain-containing protein [Micrococcales bacterium]|nr:PRC and DUF2382 domain-containing protein [Micrococcales bacterium]
MNTSQEQLDRLYSATVVDESGDKVGSVSQIYLDDNTDQPRWATVNTGFFGTRSTFVPLDRADVSDDTIRVPFSKDFIKDAPNIDDDGHIDDAQQQELYRYYSMDDTASYDDRDRVAAGGVGGVDRDRNVDVDRDRDVDVDRDRDIEGDSVVRREEELNVGKERVETGKVRLRKHVVTEQKTVTVPVEREEVEVVREPIADGDRDRGGRLGEDETEVTLTEERPVIDKEVVDKERVGLDKRTVQEEQQVNADVQREEVEIERDGNVRGDRDFDRDGNVEDNRSLKDKAKDALDRDNDGKIGR